MFFACHSLFQVAFVDSSVMLTHLLRLVSHTFALLMCVLAWKLMRPNFSNENSPYEQSKWNLTACISGTYLYFIIIFFHITCTIVETCNSFLFLWVYNSLAITRVAEDSQRSPPLSINTLIIASRQVVRVL